MKSTNWDSYYSAPYKTALFTRNFMRLRLKNLLARYLRSTESMKILELGGGNSCYLDLLLFDLNPSEYVVVDNNQTGLDCLKERTGNNPKVSLLNRDILNLNPAQQYDLVFSAGLIEHFNAADTRNALLAHFAAARPGGLVLVTFPTPTWLYKLVRWFSERLGLWIFHDERPLELEEVLQTVNCHGELLYCRIAWEMFLTQAVVLVKKHD